MVSKEQKNSFELEIYFVDEGRKGKTWKILELLARSNPRAEARNWLAKMIARMLYIRSQIMAPQSVNLSVVPKKQAYLVYDVNERSSKYKTDAFKMIRSRL
jgi:hypothetical protein